jgi:23S rRNA pseudouridine2605 synthase
MNEHITAALTGVETPLGVLKALAVEKIGSGGAKTKLRVQINEGKNRHIRRLFGAMKDSKFDTPLKVMSLTRISIGSLRLSTESGKWAYLSQDEENVLLKNMNSL